jgi:hypothetical protein
VRGNDFSKPRFTILNIPLYWRGARRLSAGPGVECFHNFWGVWMNIRDDEYAGGPLTSAAVLASFSSTRTLLPPADGKASTRRGAARSQLAAPPLRLPRLLKATAFVVGWRPPISGFEADVVGPVTLPLCYLLPSLLDDRSVDHIRCDYPVVGRVNYASRAIFTEVRGRVVLGN